MFKLIAHYYAK